ncbi:hypothetical protein DVH24_035552 [Malus domestica]|uniref:Uncharacterized protein n=1 Tax=Malus domestica TaxID=3750 RepID=A0A498J581_MALDO|nr:hypothetical protein DVH24_035552 [Malus domestica]
MLNMATIVINCADLVAAVSGLSAIEYPNQIGTNRRLQIFSSSIQLGTNSLNQEGSITLATSSDLGIDGRDELLETARCRGPDLLRNRS